MKEKSEHAMSDGKGTFIVLDGLDGSGKGTQIELLKRRLQKENRPVYFTREPGGTPYAEKIRNVILDKEGEHADALTHFLLFWAARNEHMQKCIIPALSSGAHVLSDRFDSSTFAFQIYGEECLHLREQFFARRAEIVNRFAPSLYIIFDVLPETAFARTSTDAARMRSHFDVRPVEYHARVRKGFHEFAKNFPCRIIDANRPKEDIHADVWAAVALH